MQELKSYASTLGFDLPANIELDGEVHRFGPKKVFWYIGCIAHNLRGESYTLCTFSDWRNGIRHTYKPDIKFTKEDKISIQAQFDKMAEKAEKARSIKQKEAEDMSAKIWDDAKETPDKIHEYILKKQIQSDDLNVRYHKDYIAVPVRDVKSNLVGIQKIYPDSSKWFLPGQRTKGCFHYIGLFDDVETPKIYLCEGFATGASIYLATSVPTFVAFNNHNLIEVAKSLASEYPTLDIIVCGDDDKFTKDNPGRTSAERAALICQGKAVYPLFDDPEKKQTDFNDLHVNESLQKVRDQLSKVVPVRTGFIPLGFDQGTHFFYVYSCKSIAKTTTFTETDLLQIAPLNYWEERYSGTRGIMWRELKNDLIQQSQNIGIFDSSRIRGSGVWRDARRTVINTGEYLIVDGEKTEIKQHKSSFVYVQTKNSIHNISADPLQKSESRMLFDTCSLLNWREPSQAYFLTGWLAIARIAGALPIRPHVWITGESGSGKSTIMNDIVEPCLGNKSGWLFLQGSSTEAGIRQSIAADSIPIIFDELETNDKKTSERIDSILELLRQTWSATSGKIVKGSASGYSVEYSLAFAALVSSIRIGLDNEADISRFSVLDLDKSIARNWPEIQFSLGLIDESFGDRLFSRSCSQILNILRSYKTLQSAIASRYSQRKGQQYGMLLAGYHSTVSNDTITEKEADELIDKMGFQSQNETHDSDQKKLFNHILSKKIFVENLEDKKAPRVEVSIERAIEHNQFHSELTKYGLRVRGDFLLISNSHAELSKILYGTAWAKNWYKTLLRLDGAESGLVAARFGKNNIARFVKIPLI